MSYLDDLSDIWEAVKESFRDRFAQSTIDMMFGDMTVSSFEDNTISFSITSEFKYMVVNEKYIDMIEEGFSNLLGFRPSVKVIFTGTPTNPQKVMSQILGREDPAEEAHTAKKEEEAVLAKEPEDGRPSGILPPNYKFEYTFENFIVGNTNKFAHAACLAVAQRPASDYNPLFIYGPSGLGKTHLMSAVVNEIKKKKADLRVLYIKGDDFTNQMIENITSGQMHKFHERYRNCDILLIDDIQFIAGKETTQEEFFHTFNSLYEEGKQIVLSSDRPPKDIPNLADRLKSRFEWGLLADIQPPDLELRIAIIKKKAEQVSIVIPDEVLTFLAENLRSNIRQIEGAIKKLSALSFLSGKNISMELAKSCLAELLGGAEPVNVTVDKIFNAVQTKHKISKADLLSPKRNKEITTARHLSVFLIRKITDMSYPSIAKIFNRDYATIHSSYNLMNSKYEQDSLFRIEVDEMIKDISG